MGVHDFIFILGVPPHKGGSGFAWVPSLRDRFAPLQSLTRLRIVTILFFIFRSKKPKGHFWAMQGDSLRSWVIYQTPRKLGFGHIVTTAILTTNILNILNTKRKFLR